jgi:hypothetical protein
MPMEPHLQIVPPAARVACLNCGSAVLDRFCAHCGQPADTHRITLKHWLHDIPHSVWHVDKGFPYTLGQMLRRPGPTLQRYLAGQRAPFFRPLTMLLLITGLLTFLYIVFELRPYNTHDSALPPELNAFRDRFIHFFTKYINWFSIAMLPVSGLLLKWGLRPARLNYAECLTVATFVTAISHFISLLALPLLYFMNGTANGQILMTIVVFVTMAYQVWAYTGLLAGSGLGMGARLMRGFSTAGAVSLTTLVAVTLLMGYVNRDQLAEMSKQIAAQAHMKAAPAAAAPAASAPAPRR